jgi:transposase
MDETRFGRPRWLPDGHHDGSGEDGRVRWQRTDPRETGFVDITGDQALLGQIDGRTSTAVQAWLAERTASFRAGIEVVVIDPHAGYAAVVRAALPDAVIAVDHFHLVILANKTVTAVRQRVTRDLLDRRGRKILLRAPLDGMTDSTLRALCCLFLGAVTTVVGGAPRRLKRVHGNLVARPGAPSGVS